MGDGELRDLMVYDGLTCAFDEVHMAVHGNTAAKEYGISRREQDEWALRSHARAAKAADEGKFQDEIVPVSWTNRKGKTNMVEKMKRFGVTQLWISLQNFLRFIQVTVPSQPVMLPGSTTEPVRSC